MPSSAPGASSSTCAVGTGRISLDRAVLEWLDDALALPRVELLPLTPAIAEALLATALGLVAAIPAVVIYNVFARSIAGYKAQVSDASAEVLLLVSRDLDHLPTERSSQPHMVKVG
mgnify:CR=1 FL=1